MHNPLAKQAREMLFGSLFGDAGVYKSTGSRHYHLMICHSPKQLEYMKWKEEFLKPLSTGIKQSTHFHKIRQKEYTTLTLRTTNHSYFTRLRKMFYPEGKKRIRRTLLNQLTPIGLATWFMDDGTTGVNNRNYPQLFLCTCSFTQKDNEIAQEYFQEELGIRVLIHGGQYPRLYFNKPNSIKLVEIIKPYIIPTLQYKLRFFLQTNPIRSDTVEDIV
jgi:recombination protein RecA